MTFAPEASFPLLEPDRVIELHALGLAKYGGNAGVRDKGLLLSAIHGAQTAAMYETDDGDLDVIHIAAHLLYHIARNHAFLDGNKRVAGWHVSISSVSLISG